ncbi:MAG: acyl-CoA thioesterase [Candidatus Nanopelagicales bacterium]|jgi:acyl-CoA thioester hydrolase
MPFSVEVPVTVRWRDFDALGHVNNAVFLTFLETGRDRFFHSLVGDTFLDLVLVRLEIDFKAEIPMGTEEVLVTCRAMGIGRTSMRTEEQILLPGGALAAQSATVIVARDATTRTSRPWTDEERGILEGSL